MCGIAGLLVNERRGLIGFEAEALAIVSRMTQTLEKRGPDADGVLVQLPAALGHRRLSIVELSEAGSQPMRLRENGPVLTFNGEIYNFRELRRELTDLGHNEWKGRSDTEVILRAYDQWGLSGLKRLEGIFGIGLWDPAHQRMVLMRDRLGVKPLFYGSSRLGLAFGSEIKAVLAAGGVDKTLDDQALSEYIWFGNSHGSRTIYQGVRLLEPGHWLISEGGVHHHGPWWTLEEWLEIPSEVKSLPEASIHIRDALDAAVARQLVADVPVSIFLSGGVDSSAIAAAAVRSASNQIHSYSAGFDFDGGVNELPKAARVARHLGLNHSELVINSKDIESVLIELVTAHDEPFADAANIPLYLMCKALRGSAKVVLQGDGGDELFGGYRRYSILRNIHWWKLFPRSFVSYARKTGLMGRRVARLADALGYSDSARRMALLLTTETTHQPPESVFSIERQTDLCNTTNPFLIYMQAAERFKKYEPVQQMLLTDLTVQLPSQFLAKVDRASMSVGIESRVPFLDEGLVKLAVTFPSEWKAFGLQKKIVLRQSQRGRLPNDILDGPKTGFGVPYGNWLRSSLFDFAQANLLDPAFVSRFHLNFSILEGMLKDHKSGKGDEGFMLWKLLQLALWNSSLDFSAGTT